MVKTEAWHEMQPSCTQTKRRTQTGLYLSARTQLDVLVLKCVFVGGWQVYLRERPRDPNQPIGERLYTCFGFEFGLFWEANRWDASNENRACVGHP
jgi:hypothetical protein